MIKPLDEYSADDRAFLGYVEPLRSEPPNSLTIGSSRVGARRGERLLTLVRKFRRVAAQ
jgi:hypothetical protein